MPKGDFRDWECGSMVEHLPRTYGSQVEHLLHKGWLWQTQEFYDNSS